MVKALESQGVTLSVSSGSPTSFSSIANVSKIHGPGDNAAVIDASNLDSVAREKMMGVPDEGQVTLDIFYDPDAATHLLLRSAMNSRTRMEFQIALTDEAGTTLSFGGYVVAFVINTAVNDAIRGVVTIAVDGETTDGAAPLTYATLDPARKNAAVLLSNENLTATCDGTLSLNSGLGTVFHSTGKRYYEVRADLLLNFAMCGIGKINMSIADSNRVGFDANGIGYKSTGTCDNDGNFPSYGSAWADGNVIGVLTDFDASTLKFTVNGVDQGFAPYSPDVGGSYAPAISVHSVSSITCNFGATAWAYDPPAGYVGWYE